MSAIPETKVKNILDDASRAGCHGIDLQPVLCYIKEVVAAECQRAISPLEVKVADLEAEIHDLEAEKTAIEQCFMDPRDRIGLMALVDRIMQRRELVRTKAELRRLKVLRAEAQAGIDCKIKEYARITSELEKQAVIEHIFAGYVGQRPRKKVTKQDVRTELDDNPWDILGS